MSVEERFDLVVIGAGPAGEKGAGQAAYFGKRVAVMERSAVPGGTPASTGGIPTKTMREAALYLTGFRRRESCPPSSHGQVRSLPRPRYWLPLGSNRVMEAGRTLIVCPVGGPPDRSIMQAEASPPPIG
jgi:phytoene dehydrogenase-like protein